MALVADQSGISAISIIKGQGLGVAILSLSELEHRFETGFTMGIWRFRGSVTLNQRYGFNALCHSHALVCKIPWRAIQTGAAGLQLHRHSFKVRRRMDRLVKTCADLAPLAIRSVRSLQVEV